MIQDFDGNEYTEIVIGHQTWLGENLKTTHYNDGVSIGEEDGFWWYNNDISNKDWGALYNWYALSYGTLAPIGYRIATDEDWLALTDHLGGLDCGHKLKITGDSKWETSTVFYAYNIPYAEQPIPDNAPTGVIEHNQSGTVTCSIPAGMLNYAWYVEEGGSTTGHAPTIISGGGIHDNFMEVMLHEPYQQKIFCDYTNIDSSIGSIMWYQYTLNNTESTNESGLSLIPNGYRRFSGDFLYHGVNGYYWSAATTPASDTRYRILPINRYGSSNSITETRSKWDFAPSHYQTYGFSVRCIKI